VARKLSPPARHPLRRLRIPAIAAPMLGVSGPELVTEACRNGVIGAFPTANARSATQLDEWLRQFAESDDGSFAPWCPNLIMRSPRLAQDLDCLVANRVELVITSVGSPAEAIGPLHDAGCLVLADVATLHHAHRAVEAGADGLVLLTAGAGGQTGALNPFALVRAVRDFFDGLVVLAGGIADGTALAAARMLGADLAYLGTRFIATRESRAERAYKQMLVDSSLDEVVLTRAFTGLDASMLRRSIEAAGLDPSRLDEQVSAENAAALYGSGSTGPRRWTHIWSAGHSVSGVADLPPVAELVDRLEREYHAALNDETKRTT
jgi:nitronate monooxygenase